MRIIVIYLLFCFITLLQAEIKITTLANETYHGKILKIFQTPKPGFLIQVKRGQKKIHFIDIVEVVCQNTTKKQSSRPCIYLNDGSRIYGEITHGDANSITIDSPSLGHLKVSTMLLKEIRFLDNLPNVQRNKEYDVLYFHNQDVLYCTIERFGKQNVQVRYEDKTSEEGEEKSLKVYFKNIKRISFAEFEPPKKKSQELSVTILGIDDSKLFGQLVDYKDETLYLHSKILKKKFSISLRGIQRFLFVNGKYIYLSDMPKNKYQIRYTPYLSGGDDRSFLPKFNKNQWGNRMILNNQAFHKGIGCYPKTEIQILLEQKYKKFQSYIGIDDQIRRLKEKEGFNIIGGTAIFRIYVDDEKKAIFDSGIVSYDTYPKSIEVDVKGRKTMRLVVDFADIRSHANSLANWAGARLLK